jgi:hypothetical protein
MKGMPLQHLLQSSAEIATLKRVPKTPMDVHATLLELLARKRQLENIIAELEELKTNDGSSVRRRGRKYMPAEERQEVSQRMRRYWAGRRNQQTA